MSTFVARSLILALLAMFYKNTVQAQALPVLPLQIIPDSSFPMQLGLCQGDCDSDEHCGPNLVCFERSGSGPVPGCGSGGGGGGGEKDSSPINYCVLEERTNRALQTHSIFQHDAALPLLFLGSDPPGEVFPLGLCEGDCDNDDQCAVGLVCFQRGRYDPVPGCSGVDESLSDYCIDPASLSQTSNRNTASPAPLVGTGISRVFVGVNPPADSLPLGLCHGDCDRDDQCATGLVCYQRKAYDPIPGCLGLDSSHTDYCVDPSLVPNAGATLPPATAPFVGPIAPPITVSPTSLPPRTTLPALVEYGSSPPADMLPLRQCEGDCDNDSQCSDNLVCFQRSAFEPVPGCSGVDASHSDYCVTPESLGLSEPTPIATPTNAPAKPPAATPVSSPSGALASIPLVEYGSSPPADRLPLGRCEGDCDSDSQCAAGLVCFQRSAYMAVPGCIGVDPSNSDYCIDPTAPVQSSTSDPVDDGNISEGYIPGKLVVRKVGLLLSQGLDARWLATTDARVPYANGQQSSIPFHVRPDAGACYEDTRPGNPGGFVYVSNSEARENGQGGVGAITFDAQGNVLDYRMLLTGTTMNCGGGRTPWNTWVTCEEKNDRSGRAFQVDPLGQRPPSVMSMGDEGGRWESFASEARNGLIRHFYMTEDHPRGALLRFTPSNPLTGDPWTMLTDPGTKVYLKLHPNGGFEWTSDRASAMENARVYYRDTEGIDVRNHELFFVSKSLRRLYTLDLDAMTWSASSTVSGLFDGQPDQLQRLLHTDRNLLYFTEEGGVDAGIHARDNQARFFTVMESPAYPGETTGLAMSPDGRFMIVAYQDVGRVFMLWRQDGKAFGGDHLDIKYHDSVSRRMML